MSSSKLSHHTNKSGTYRGGIDSEEFRELSKFPPSVFNAALEMISPADQCDWKQVYVPDVGRYHIAKCWEDEKSFTIIVTRIEFETDLVQF